MNANEISQQVMLNQQLVKDLKSELYEEKRKLEKKYDEKITPAENFIYMMKQNYKDLATEIAIEIGECPTSCWGQPLDPDEVFATEEGIVLMWEEQNSYSASRFHYYTVTWEDLINKENNNGEQNETD